MVRRPSPIYLDSPSQHIGQNLALPRRKLIAFGWYGGKFSHLDWLLPLLPECHHYCEPYGGSAAVLLNRRLLPVETYNDLDGEVVNFFRVLRNQKDELIEAIGLTPSPGKNSTWPSPPKIIWPSWSARGDSLSAPVNRARDWRKPPRWDAGQTAKIPAGLVCPAQSPAGWAAWRVCPQSPSGCPGCRSKTGRPLS